MNISIRNALPSDAEAVSSIILDSMGYENPPRLIAENIKRLSELSYDKILIAELNGEAVGFIHAENYDCLYAPPLKDLMSFAVKQEHQHKGIGSRLLKEIEEWAKETGRAGVRILSSDNRLSAHKFYISRGYVTEKTQMNFHKFF